MYTCNISYALVQAASSCLRSFSPSNRAYIYMYTLILAPSICATLVRYIIIAHTHTQPYIYIYMRTRNLDPNCYSPTVYADVQLDVTLYVYAICIPCIKYIINSTADRPGLTMQTGRVMNG